MNKKYAKPQPVGRPKKPKNQLRSKQITVRLTIKEMKDLETAAHDKLVADIAHKILVEGSKREIKKQKKAS